MITRKLELGEYLKNLIHIICIKNILTQILQHIYTYENIQEFFKNKILNNNCNKSFLSYSFLLLM